MIVLVTTVTINLDIGNYSVLSMAASKRKAVVFPKNAEILFRFGENIKLARLRRKYTQTLIADRTGISRLTLRKIEKGDPTVSLGHYVSVLSVLGLASDFENVAKDDILGQKLRDIELMKGK